MYGASFFFSQLLKQTAFTFKRFAKNFHQKKGNILWQFLNAITTSATVAIAAAFENRFETRGTNIFPISPSAFANEVYGHKVKVQKYETLDVLIFDFKGRAGACCFVSSTGRAKNVENVRPTTLWHQDVRKIKLFSHFYPLGIALPAPDVFLQTTFNHINNSAEIVRLQVWDVRSVKFEPFTVAATLPEESRYVNLLCFDDPPSYHA